MTVFVLVTGSLLKPPERRNSASGRSYVSATIKVGGETSGAEFWSTLCFSESGQAELLRLGAGDALSVQGKCKTELWQKDGGEVRISRTCFVDHVLALSQPPRERKPKKQVAQPATPGLAKVSVLPPIFDDEVPF